MRHGCTYVGTYCTYIISRIQENLLNKSVLHNRKVLEKVANECISDCRWQMLCCVIRTRYLWYSTPPTCKKMLCKCNFQDQDKKSSEHKQDACFATVDVVVHICMYISIQCTTSKTRYQPINNNKDGKKKV